VTETGAASSSRPSLRRHTRRGSGPSCAIALVAVLATMVACTDPARQTPVVVIDLLRDVPRAERRVLPVDDAITVAPTTLGGTTRSALVMTSPSRVTWNGIRLPPGGVLRAHVGVLGGGAGGTLLFRVGISDDRLYEELLTETVTAPDPPAWRVVEVSLARYAGWQWSVFYRPDRRSWNLVLNVSVPRGNRPRSLHGVWGDLAIATDRERARSYWRRHAASP
jgi:hypothetical protein